MVSQPIEQGSSEFFVGKDLDPLGKRQIGSEDGRAALVTLRQQIEQQLAAGAPEGHESGRKGARRYERASLIITSNKSFIDWGEVFGDQVLATAILDRLLHHSSTINIKGESFRLKEKRRAGLLSQQAPETTAAPARNSTKSSDGGAD